MVNELCIFSCIRTIACFYVSTFTALDLHKALEVMAASVDRASLDLGEWEGSGIWFVQKRVRVGAHIR